MRKKLTQEEKLQLLTTTTLAFTKGIIPPDLNSIAPDYVYYFHNEIYINIFLTEPICHDVLGLEVFSKKNHKILTEAMLVVKQNFNKKNADTIIYPTLLNTDVEAIIGMVVSNTQILP